MKTLTSQKTILLLVVASGSLAVSACGGNSSSSSDESSTTGGTGGIGGTGGSGGVDTASSTNTATASVTTGSNGTSGSVVTTGGAGGTSGADGTTASGSDSGGTSDSGGVGGDGGSAGTIDSTSAGGSAGAGGDDGAGVIGVLGESCDEPGKLACAGNHQKLTVVCGGDGEWEVNETCPGDQLCDSLPGTRAGSCQDPVPECVEQEAGFLYCDGYELRACGPDTVNSELVEVCTGACVDAGCDNFRDGCPEEPYINCADDCHGRDETCKESCGQEIYAFEYVNDVATLRLAAARDTCVPECSPDLYGRWIRPDVGLPDTRIKITVPRPWRIQVAESEALDICDEPFVYECLIVEQQLSTSTYVFISTDDFLAEERNVTFSLVGADEECP